MLKASTTALTETLDTMFLTRQPHSLLCPDLHGRELTINKGTTAAAEFTPTTVSELPDSEYHTNHETDKSPDCAVRGRHYGWALRSAKTLVPTAAAVIPWDSINHLPQMQRR
ncbi:hypothetical protein GCM10027167_80620 [Nocardia heshunensis]